MAMIEIASGYSEWAVDSMENIQPRQLVPVTRIPDYSTRHMTQCWTPIFASNGDDRDVLKEMERLDLIMLVHSMENIPPRRLVPVTRIPDYSTRHMTQCWTAIIASNGDDRDVLKEMERLDLIMLVHSMENIPPRRLVPVTSIPDYSTCHMTQCWTAIIASNGDDRDVLKEMERLDLIMLVHSMENIPPRRLVPVTSIPDYSTCHMTQCWTAIIASNGDDRDVLKEMERLDLIMLVHSMENIPPRRLVPVTSITDYSTCHMTQCWTAIIASNGDDRDVLKEMERLDLIMLVRLVTLSGLQTQWRTSHLDGLYPSPALQITLHVI
ncbi:hypothetical protein J6590_022642 [Homalodisca vitripennis]|nr:hypothetical protein J6590_022642 [Homalodisca vitripennis]